MRKLDCTTSKISSHTNLEVQWHPRAGLRSSWSFLRLCSFTLNCNIFLIGVQRRFVKFEMKYWVWDVFQKLSHNYLPELHIPLIQQLRHFNGESGKDKRGTYSLNGCLMTDLLCRQILKHKSSGFLCISKVVKG